MKAPLSLFFCALMTVCLVSCAARGPVASDDISGVWTDGEGRLVCLDADGALAYPGRTDASGLDWTFKDGTLVLRTLETPDRSPVETRLAFKERGLRKMTFTDGEGRPLVWKKSRQSVERLEGTLFYRERMMLPPEVTVCVRLWKEGDCAPAAFSLLPVRGQGELPFRVHYLEKDVENAASLTASVHFGGEILFATPKKTPVALDGRPSVLLHHAVTENDPPLMDTYWHLRSVGGREVVHHDDQPEPHLVLRKGGEASGSDGCNNFFMDWKGDCSRIAFSGGGATLRLCPHGEEQARAMMEALAKAEAWEISGSRLTLSREGKPCAVFEAVDM